jgi:UDP-N-acetylmuramyl tripeptide synthase
LNDAKSGDIVLITGKGSEQAMVLSGGRKIPWDDREVVRRVLTS